MVNIQDEDTAAFGIKLFNKWSFDDVEVKDLALTDYIQIRNPVYLPHTAGRYQVKRFRKAQVKLSFLINSSAQLSSALRTP
jgi:small subunit ribosomal protein S5e